MADYLSKPYFLCKFTYFATAMAVNILSPVIIIGEK